jgi:hypothetical protein
MEEIAVANFTIREYPIKSVSSAFNIQFMESGATAA